MQRIEPLAPFASSIIPIDGSHMRVAPIRRDQRSAEERRREEQELRREPGAHEEEEAVPARPHVDVQA